MKGINSPQPASRKQVTNILQMKKLQLKTILACLLFLGLIAPNFSTLQAQDTQDAPNSIAVFNYMKSKNKDYQKVEKEIWQPYMKQAIKDGKMEWWAIYSVEFPFGTHTQYDYVAVQVFANMEQLENAWDDLPERMKKVHPKMTMAEIEKRTEEARDMVWGESFNRLAYAVLGDGTPAKFAVVNKMQSNPGKYNQYIEMELNIFKSAHQMAVKNKLRQNWHFLSRALPYGTFYGYDFMTIDSYKSLTQLTKETPANVWQEAHPDKDIEEMWKELNPEKMRAVVRGEVWKNIMYEKKEVGTVVEK